MKQNVGSVDRYLRISIGIVLIILGVMTRMWWLYIIAAIAILTGIFGYCGIYQVFGASTAKK
jgi:hypothetical protein